MAKVIFKHTVYQLMQDNIYEASTVSKALQL